MAHLPKLFQPITFRSVTSRNRIAVAPMCQYSAEDGLGDDWHVQHLGARSMGGAGIVFTEALHVSAIGRITPGCLGLWNPAHEHLLGRLSAIITRGGAVPGVQIAHAGRKASSARPWDGGKGIPPDQGGWVPVGPSATPFGEAHTTPHALSADEIHEIAGQFAATARMSREAGFKVIEIHGAHGYLIHSFLSPISNTRNDEYGGDLKGRARLLLEVVDAVRSEWPDDLPLFVRLSCVDWMEGGLTIDDTVEVAKMLKASGKVDLIDCSSGGVAAVGPKIPSLHAGYQVPFADAIKHRAGIATGAV
ncbi:MAG TPA: NADH:flavin oxidoreductase/NADH oxidase, partial [Acetobacteraceae bacterium]